MSRPTGWEVVGYESDPVPGDHYDVGQLAREYTRIGDVADDASNMLSRMNTADLSKIWSSDAAETFVDAIDDMPLDLDKVVPSYHAVGTTLSSWATTIDETQFRADRALESAKSAHADLVSAQSRLADANADLSSHDSTYTSKKALYEAHKDEDPLPAGVPTAAQVKAAADNRSVASGRVSDANADISAAQSRIDAAKRLVDEAHGDWTDSERTTEKGIKDAGDAGLGKEHWWDTVFQSDAWDVFISICKVFVAIAGIIVLIIGGPLAWVVFAAALLILADTLYEMSQGRAGWGDVIFALLDCIPGTKGITSLARLGKAAAEGMTVGAKILKVGAQFLSDGKGFVKDIGLFAKNVFNGSLLGQLDHMRAVAVHTIAGPGEALFASLKRGDSFAETIKNVGGGFAHGFENYKSTLTDPVEMARMWQGDFKSGYVGVDDWKLGDGPLAGKFESGYPGTSPFTVSDGTMNPDALMGDAASHYEGVQVGNSSDYQSLRGEGLRWETSGTGDVPYAVSEARANPQFGAGGTEQFFVPGFGEHVAEGRITILDRAGDPVPLSNLSIDGDKVWVNGVKDPTIIMTNQTPHAGVWMADQYVDRLKELGWWGVRAAGAGATVQWDFSSSIQSVDRELVR